jgi:hypothetical protein
MVNAAAMPLARSAALHEIVPEAPTAGFEHVHPEAPELETNVVPAGSGSVNVTSRALLGPAFATVTV